MKSLVLLTPVVAGGGAVKADWELRFHSAVLLFVVGPADQPDHDQQHCYHHAPKVKAEAATAVVELLMMGVRTPETC